jgi:hypothetical protein
MSGMRNRILQPGIQRSGVGTVHPEIRCRFAEFGRPMPDPGCAMPGRGGAKPEFGKTISETGPQIADAANTVPAIGSPLSEVSLSSCRE